MFGRQGSRQAKAKVDRNVKARSMAAPVHVRTYSRFVKKVEVRACVTLAALSLSVASVDPENSCGLDAGGRSRRAFTAGQGRYSSACHVLTRVEDKLTHTH